MKNSTLPLRAIDRINQTSMNKLRFRDFLALRCGRDYLSRLRIGTLRTMVSVQQLDAVQNAFGDQRLQAACLRWILRGLEVGKAIRKVNTEAQVSADRGGSLSNVAEYLSLEKQLLHWQSEMAHWSSRDNDDELCQAETRAAIVQRKLSQLEECEEVQKHLFQRGLLAVPNVTL